MARGPEELEGRAGLSGRIAQGLGAPKVTQCEVTYVNHIVAGLGWKTHGDVSRVMVNWHQTDDSFLPGIEDATLSWRYVIRAQKNFLGRLHVSLQPAYRSQDGTDSEIFVLTLTARGKQELQARGFTVVEQVGSRIDIVD